MQCSMLLRQAGSLLYFFPLSSLGIALLVDPNLLLCSAVLNLRGMLHDQNRVRIRTRDQGVGLSMQIQRVPREEPARDCLHLQTRCATAAVAEGARAISANNTAAFDGGSGVAVQGVLVVLHQVAWTTSVVEVPGEHRRVVASRVQIPRRRTVELQCTNCSHQSRTHRYCICEKVHHASLGCSFSYLHAGV